MAPSASGLACFEGNPKNLCTYYAEDTVAMWMRVRKDAASGIFFDGRLLAGDMVRARGL